MGLRKMLITTEVIVELCKTGAALDGVACDGLPADVVVKATRVLGAASEPQALEFTLASDEWEGEIGGGEIAMVMPRFAVGSKPRDD